MIARVVENPWLRRLAGDSLLRQFVRGASAAFLIGVVSRVITFPINIVLARVMGADHFGAYIFVGSWLGVFLLVGTLGFHVSLLRFAPAYIDAGEWGLLRGLLRRAMQLVLGATVVIAIGVAVVTLLLFDRMEDYVAYTFLVVCIVLPLSGIGMLRTAALRAVDRIGWAEGLDEIVSPLMHALAVVALFFALGRTMSSHVAMMLIAAVEVVAFVVGTVVLNRALPAATWTAEAVHRTREWLRVSVPLSFVTGLIMALNTVDIIIIGIMIGPTEAGIYAVAANLARFTMFGLVAADIASQPMVAPLFQRGDRAGLRRLVLVVVWSSALLAVGIGLSIIVLREFLLGLFGTEFLAGSTVLILLVAGRIINAVTGPSGSLLAMTAHQDMNAVILGVAVGFNVPATILGAMWWGIEGAALATMLSLTILTIWTWIEVRRRLGINASIFAGLPFRS